MNNELSPEDRAFYEARKQKKTTALKALRVTINTAIAEAKSVAEAEFMRGAGVDELSSAIHNLKQARMWAGEALGEIGHKLPPEYRDEGRAMPNEIGHLLSIKELAQRYGNGLQELFGCGLLDPVLVYPDGHPEQAEVYFTLKPAVPADVDNS